MCRRKRIWQIFGKTVEKVITVIISTNSDVLFFPHETPAFGAATFSLFPQLNFSRFTVHQ